MQHNVLTVICIRLWRALSCVTVGTPLTRDCRCHFGGLRDQHRPPGATYGDAVHRLIIPPNSRSLDLHPHP